VKKVTMRPDIGGELVPQSTEPVTGPPDHAFRLTVVVPAYQAVGRIEETISRLRLALGDVEVDGGVEILVVDDGSSDGTGESARAAGADKVVVFPHNRGKGAAVRAGMLAARGRTVAFTDADLAYSPDQILRLLAAVEGGWDVVVGSRRRYETSAVTRGGLLRDVTGRVFNLFTRGVLEGHYPDTQCGLKAFRADVAHRIFSASKVDRFAFDVEMFHLAERFQLSLLEMPVDLSDTQTSTVRIRVDSLRMLRDLVRLRLWAWQGVYDEAAAPTPLRARAMPRFDGGSVSSPPPATL